MGMCSTVAYIDARGKVSMTSVQWMTQFDTIVGERLAKIDASDRADFVRKVFKTITKYGHITSIDDTHDSEGFYKQVMVEGTDLFISWPINNDVEAAHCFKVSKDFINAYNKVSQFCLAGGLGAIFDEVTPDRVTFFYDGVDGVFFESVSLDDLAVENFKCGYHKGKSV